MSLENLKIEFAAKLAKCQNVADVEALRVEYVGKNGLITEQSKTIVSLPVDERKAFGSQINSVKSFVEEAIAIALENKRLAELNESLQRERIDISLAPPAFEVGKQHVITKVMDDLKAILSSMEYVEASGPEIEDDWYNFTALNIPALHPARQMHDTFYVEGGTRLLRTHTSNVEIRHMEKHQPPLKIFSIGRVYRSDSDATHTPMFHQLEGLYIDENINMATLKSHLDYLLKSFFGVENLPTRMRPSYFPFTEPSAEFDVLCDRSHKGEITFGSGNDWLEILGCGMTHPKVLENVGIDSSKYQGFAFGMGIERLAMLRHNITDLRDMFLGDLKWLKHFGA
jgi:phenylalanyl-tRNA synthetase alpha chain